MNQVYQSPTMVVHDDREPITAEQAFELLWDFKYIRINDLPDFSAENECDIYGIEFSINMLDIIPAQLLHNQPKDESRKQVHQYLIGYEIYR